jgi:hypothetical protein
MGIYPSYMAGPDLDIYVYMRVCMYICVYARMYVCMYVIMYVCMVFLGRAGYMQYTHTHTRIHLCIYNTHTHTHKPMYTCMYIHTTPMQVYMNAF